MPTRYCRRYPDAVVEAPNDEASKDSSHSHRVAQRSGGFFFMPCSGELAHYHLEDEGHDPTLDPSLDLLPPHVQAAMKPCGATGEDHQRGICETGLCGKELDQ